MLALSTQHELVAALRRQLKRWEATRRPAAPGFTSGSRALDRILPTRGFRRGTLVEYLADQAAGALALALIAAREACREGGALVVVDRARQFYPPAAANLGVDLNSAIFCRPRTQKDQLWALNQALACQGVGVVLCRPATLDDRAFRALQLATETAGTVGLFIRPISIRGQPTWSEMQFLVEALPAAQSRRRLRIELVRCRNAGAGKSIELELDDETGTLQESRDVHLVPAVAAPAVAKRTTRA